jgi:hypothetical protein
MMHVCARTALFAFLVGCSGPPSDTDAPVPTTEPSTNDDKCDSIGDPAVLLGTLSDAGVFAPWAGTATFATGAVPPTATAPSATLLIGIAAPNLQIEEFTYVDLVATDGATQLFSSSIATGFTCDEATGPVGVMRVTSDWGAVTGHSITFSATIADVTGASSTGTATVTVNAP